MPAIEGEITVRRPPEDVFDFVADERNEPRFNPKMASVELLTPEPIGVGSRFRAQMKMIGRPVEMTVEFTQFGRPRLLGSKTWSAFAGRKGKLMLTEGALTFAPCAEGTRMRWRWNVETPGAMRLLAPSSGGWAEGRSNASGLP